MMIIQTMLSIAGFNVGHPAAQDDVSQPCNEIERDALYQNALCREQNLTGCGGRTSDVDDFYRYLVPQMPTSPCQRW